MHNSRKFEELPVVKMMSPIAIVKAGFQNLTIKLEHLKMIESNNVQFSEEVLNGPAVILFKKSKSQLSLKHVFRICL